MNSPVFTLKEIRMNKKFAVLLGTLMWMGVSAVHAQTPASAPAKPVVAAATAPDALVKNTVDEVLGFIRTTKDKRALNELVEKKVLPNFDFQAMTQLAVGRHWREASPAQQKSLENAFRALLVNTYAMALTQSTAVDQTVEVRPAPVKPTDDEVTVRTFVKEPGRKPIAINYRMAKAAAGWKVNDVVVEDLSLVTNYRGSFNTEIGKSGIDGLIKSLEAKNKSNAEG
jgi:phospholipid transport system substrate-binding protein